MSAVEQIEHRYGAPQAWQPSGWNAVLDTLLAHRSVRAYLPTSLPDGALETAIAAAQSASSSSNLQVWSVVAVADQARKARLAALAGGQAHIEQAPLFLVWLADLARIEAIAAGRQAPVEALPYLESFVTAVIDAALAAQNAVTAFESMGLGTVYIGAMRNHPVEVAAELALPPKTMAVFGMCVGFPDPDVATAVKPRLPQSAVLHRETYDPDQSEAIAAYDPILQAFFAAQGIHHAVWTRQSVKRLKGPESLSGRDVLRAALASLGFELR